MECFFLLLSAVVTGCIYILEVESVQETELKKEKYKKLIRDACYDKDAMEMRQKMKSKCSEIQFDKFELQPYMKNNSLRDIRELFRIKIRMNHLRANFPSDPKHKVEGGMVCMGCGVEKETNTHMTECVAYADLLEGRVLRDDSDLVGFYREVMARRDKKDRRS